MEFFMKKIFIVVGRSGAGKSTLCEELEHYFNYPLFSFKSMATKYANENGYSTLREHYSSMDFDKYKILVSEYILNVLTEQLNKNDVVIIDGLYIDTVVEKLENNYNCTIIYLQTDDVIRYERIAQRMSMSIEEAKRENELRTKSTTKLGRDVIIEKANYIIDGNKSKDEVFLTAKKYIENCIYEMNYTIE